MKEGEGGRKEGSHSLPSQTLIFVEVGLGHKIRISPVEVFVTGIKWNLVININPL